MKKRILSTIITGLICGGAIAFGLEAGPAPHVTNAASSHSSTKASFSDISSDYWAAAEIKKAREQGYIDGYADGTFLPGRNVSRAEFVKMAVAALGIDAGQADGAQWYAPAMDAAAAAGIYRDGDFADDDLNAPMSRQEMAKVAVRAIGQDTPIEEKWMYLATKAGLIQGMDHAGKLGLEENTNRAQSVTVISRIQTVRSGGTLPADKYAISSAEIAWHKTNIVTMLPRYFSAAQSYSDIDYKNLKVSGGDGNFTCEVEKFVVIDMEDPNDPNRHLLPDGTKWFDAIDRKTYPIPNESFVVLSLNKLVVKDNPYGITRARACTLALRNQTLKDPSLTPKAGVLYQLTALNIKDTYGYDTGSSGVVTINGVGVYEYVNGHILPKGNLVSSEINPITFYRLADFGISPIKVYGSKIDESI
ncbi:S-layer homology domain-containing protein [Paenibacillus sp. FJAT-26967]|uniref:S-layer homology domain-containing protein n=1 Tax=Paenibacillus sp. FJAT-26967 TaxID=1729690 RepID=UPI000837DCEC|nr:S-layer homology domain-containing protein [Paenibacillus sp. FJAT-26967]